MSISPCGGSLELFVVSPCYQSLTRYFCATNALRGYHPGHIPQPATLKGGAIPSSCHCLRQLQARSDEMCNYTLWVTNEKNRCGNHNVVIADYIHPEFPYEAYQFNEVEDMPYRVRCDDVNCRFREEHRSASKAHQGDYKGIDCDFLRCPKGPFVGTETWTTCDDYDDCGLVDCSVCHGGADVQQYIRYEGDVLKGIKLVKPCVHGQPCHCRPKKPRKKRRSRL